MPEWAQCMLTVLAALGVLVLLAIFNVLNEIKKILTHQAKDVSAGKLHLTRIIREIDAAQQRVAKRRSDY